MIAVIENRSAELIELCHRFNVDRLELFGSAAKGTFKLESSDLDFIVNFANRKEGSYLDRFLDFADALSQLFGRHVDVLTENMIRNPYFKQAVDSSRTTIYERIIEETPV